MNRRWLLPFAVLAAVTRFAAAQTPTTAEESKPLADSLTGEALTLYQHGRLLYNNRDWAAAELEFDAAYKQSGDPRLLFNVAICETNQRHYAKASGLLAKFLAQEDPRVGARAREEAQTLADQIRPFSLAVRIRAAEPGASVYVDDELVGTTPLGEPLVLDVGTRKITVRKPGFQEFSQSVPVGGTTEIVVDVALKPEVHEGKLLVGAPAGATIFLDRTPIGVGHAILTLASGGHILRVTQPGMRSYQSEIVIKDDEARSVEVVLEPEEPDTGPLHGFELALRGAYGWKMRADNPAVSLAWLDIGYRIGRPTLVGVYGQLGQLSKAGTCGTDVHGPSPDYPTDLEFRYSFTQCLFFKIGVEIAYHLGARRRFDPWVGIDFGFGHTFYSERVFDPVRGTYTNESGGSESAQAGLQLGLDVRPFERFAPFAAGVFGAYGLTMPFNPGDDSFTIGFSDTLLRFPTVHSVKPYGNLVFGLRTLITL